VAARPGLHFEVHRRNIRAGEVVAFLDHLRRRLGRVTVVWDRNQIHSRSTVVRG